MAGSQAMIVLCMSMAMGSVAPGHTGLAMFVLMMHELYSHAAFTHAHMPDHMCEDFSVSLGDLVKKNRAAGTGIYGDILLILWYTLYGRILIAL